MLTPSPVVSRGPRDRHCALVRGPVDHVRAAGGEERASWSLYGAWFDRHARFVGRQSWSARPGSPGTALTRGARSGALHVSPEGCLLAVLGSEGRQSTAPVDGPHRGEPNGLVGLSLYELRPLGILGLHSCQEAF